jgi:hypothetical protein
MCSELTIFDLTKIVILKVKVEKYPNKINIDLSQLNRSTTARDAGNMRQEVVSLCDQVERFGSRL